MVIRNQIIALLGAVMTIACILWNLDVPTRLGFAILKQQYMAFELACALAIVFLKYNLKGEAEDKTAWFDILFSACAFLVVLYAAIDFSWLLSEQAYRPWQIVMIGTVIVLGVMEGVRRRVGWMLFSIIGVFLVYALFADKAPGQLVGKELSLTKLVQYVGFDPSAVFSSPLAVGTIIVLLFVFFGRLLFAAGGGAFFSDLAMAATGRSRGGSAKISVVASALFGSISGSAVSNVVTTGVVTIPLMQRGGYSQKDSGAIEAVASTGGQLTPPIMGAAAFLMAEFLDISYMTVAGAALLPAVLYYISVFTQVDLIAGRDEIHPSDADNLTPLEVIKEGWHFILPFGVLIGALFWWQLDPEDSALLAAVAIVLVGFLRSYNGQRLSLKTLCDVFIDTGVGMVDLILVVAAAGFVIGILNITGLGFALTLLLVDAVGSNVVLLLGISAFICIILGMGMPTSGVYVLLAALVAPSLVEFGIQPIAAHMFILYFGMMSMITPPVALAAFAASSISKADPLETGFAAMRVGWASFIIPFIFVASPALLLEGSQSEIALTMFLSIIGIISVTIAIVGYWSGRLSLLTRFIFVSCGFLSLPLGFLQGMEYLHLPGAGIVVALAIALKFFKRDKSYLNAS